MDHDALSGGLTNVRVLLNGVDVSAERDCGVPYLRARERVGQASDGTWHRLPTRETAVIRNLIEWFRDLPPGAKLGIAGLITGGVLGTFAAIGKSKGLLFGALGAGGGGLAFLVLAWLRNR